MRQVFDLGGGEGFDLQTGEVSVQRGDHLGVIAPRARRVMPAAHVEFLQARLVLFAHLGDHAVHIVIPGTGVVFMRGERAEGAADVADVGELEAHRVDEVGFIAVFALAHEVR